MYRGLDHGLAALAGPAQHGSNGHVDERTALFALDSTPQKLISVSEQGWGTPCMPEKDRLLMTKLFLAN